MKNIPRESKEHYYIEHTVCVTIEEDPEIEVCPSLSFAQPVHSDYDGPYFITPEPFTDIELDTAGKTLGGDVTVYKIPYYETSNMSGLTVYIG